MAAFLVMDNFVVGFRNNDLIIFSLKCNKKEHTWVFVLLPKGIFFFAETSEFDTYLTL